MQYERESIRQLQGYLPGEQPDCLEVSKLNTNENPYPPSELVMETLRGITGETLRRYPSPTCESFRRVAARIHGINPENIIATNGGDELLRLAVTTFVDKDAAIGVAEPGYSLYSVLAAIHECKVVRVSMTSGWELPRDFIKVMNTSGVKLTFIVNPHAPSGNLINAERIRHIAGEIKGVLLIDEAYVDFVEPELSHDIIRLIRNFDNLLLLRTMSKGYSLAGLRFGYGIGAASLIEPMLRKTKDSYNVDAVAQRLAIAALESRREAAKTWEIVRKERTWLREEFEKIGIECPVSQTNFLLARIPENFGGGARTVFLLLKKFDIFVRYFAQEGLNDKLRISIGTPEQNRRLIEVLRTLKESKFHE